ncbi:MAG: TM2 domain-containing protein [Hyphomicrobiales bacterium]
MQRFENSDRGYSPVSADAHALMTFQANKKSVGIAYLLWFFLGPFGAHRFYLGAIGTAVVMLVITILSILFSVVGIGLIGFLIVGIWLLVDAFLIPGIARDKNNALISRLA